MNNHPNKLHSRSISLRRKATRILVVVVALSMIVYGSKYYISRDKVYLKDQLARTSTGSYLLDLVQRNKAYLKGKLTNNSTGSYLLDLYNSIDSVQLSIDINPISYSIYQDKNTLPKDDKTARDKLPEFAVIPGLEPTYTNHTKIDLVDFNTWRRSNADDYSSKYSQHSQINRSNVQRLELAWIYHSGENKWDNNVEANPIFASGKIFAASPANFLISIDAATGRENWRTYIPELARRGLLWWPGNEKHEPRLFVPSNEGTYAINPENGKIIKDFGRGGRVGNASLIAPVVDDNMLIVAALGLPPSVEAYNVETGTLIWKTGLLKANGFTSPDADQRSATDFRIGGGVPWSGMSLDKGRSKLYVSTGNPRPSLYGATRPGRNEYSSSIVCVETKSGAISWSFQEVAHDLWDFDVPSPPVLLTINRNGRPIDVVATVTKIGNTILLDRDNGKPVFDYRLKKAPVSDVPGEDTWPYQPAVELPEPFMKQVFDPSDITDLSEAQTNSVKRKLRDAKFGFFMPPTINGKVALFGLHGGAEWPGAAVDEEAGVLYVTSNQYPWIIGLHYADKVNNPISSVDPVGDGLYNAKCAGCHGKDRQGYYEREFTGDLSYPSLVGITAKWNSIGLQKFRADHVGLPVQDLITEDELATIVGYLRAADHISDERRSLSITHFWQLLLDNAGYPGSKPPWGLLSAIDLNNGKKIWQVPFGEYPELAKKGVPITGQPNFGGLLVTKGGIVVATGTIDKKIRVFDASTGNQLWEYELPAAGSAPPTTYEIDGTQYIIVMATGGIFAGFRDHSDAIVAFKLKKQ